MGNDMSARPWESEDGLLGPSAVPVTAQFVCIIYHHTPQVPQVLYLPRVAAYRICGALYWIFQCLLLVLLHGPILRIFSPRTPTDTTPSWTRRCTRIGGELQTAVD
eukprot:264622-Rhodomonas_salina.5